MLGIQAICKAILMCPPLPLTCIRGQYIAQAVDTAVRLGTLMLITACRYCAVLYILSFDIKT